MTPRLSLVIVGLAAILIDCMAPRPPSEGSYLSGKNRSATASCSGTSRKKPSRWQ